MSRQFKIKVRSYDAATGSATFDVPPESSLAFALASGVLGHLTVAVEPPAASTAGGAGHDAITRAVELDEARAARDRWLSEFDAASKRLATVAASNDRLASQLEALRGALANARHQRDAAEAKVKVLTDAVATAWPVIQKVFTQIYLRLEPLMRHVALADPEVTDPRCPSCGNQMAGAFVRHAVDCPNG
jgi:hypothetical protein